MATSENGVHGVGDDVEKAEEKEENLCPICLEPWEKSGSHRLCSLPCGHIFGYRCVELWLSKKKMCPSCNAAVKSKLWIRPIYGTAKLTVVDRGREASLEAELEKEKRMKLEAQRETAALRLRCRMLEDEVHRLSKERIAPAKRAEEFFKRAENQDKERQRSYSFVQKFSVPIHGCKSVEIDNKGWYVYASRAIPNSSLFDICRCSSLDGRIERSIVSSHHQSQIRDIRCGPAGGKNLVCSASLDKTLTLHHPETLATALKYSLPGPVSSCCWLPSDNLVACGTSSMVFVFDLRTTSRELLSFSGMVGGGPVHSLFWEGCTSRLVACTPKNIFSRGIDVSSSADSLQDDSVISTSLPALCQSAFPLADRSGQVICAYRELPEVGPALLAYSDVKDMSAMTSSPVVGHLPPISLSRSCSASIGGELLVLTPNENPKGVGVFKISRELERIQCPSLETIHSSHAERISDIRAHQESGVVVTASETQIEIFQYQ